ncbi:MAG: DUF4157 domain-containing protein [Gaiellaceae bacterium]
MTRTPAQAARAGKAAARPVSRPHDRDEREAEHAADVVTRGGSVAGWSFATMPASAPEPVQRQEAVKEKTDDEKKKEALKKAGEAALKTPQGQAVKEKVLADPLVKTVTDAITSPVGLAVTGTALAGGVAALAATGKELPIQPPELPLEKLWPKLAGVSAQVTYEGPVNKPTFVGLTITVREQGQKGKGAKKTDPIAADIARLKAQEEMFRPASEKAAQKQQEDEAVAAWLARQKGLPGFTIPLKTDAPKQDEEKAPAQPAPASPSAAPPAYANVDDALATPGRPLDPSTRRAMEARFGYDFARVRVHDDARAAAGAARLDAAAFTVGEDVVFGAGRYAPASHAGHHLLAHELAHVAQQSASPLRGRDGHASPIQRKVVVKGVEMPPKQRGAFLAARKWASKALARSVLDDMADAGDTFDFTDEGELTSELVKRVATAEHTVESQQTVEKVPGDKRSAFGYPFSGPAVLYGPRVNYAARDFWKPLPPDDYALRKDKAKNKALLDLPRHERFRVYGDMGDYSWLLTDKGKADPYSAIAFLFVPEQPHRRTLLHCDYLISIVHFMSLADSVGKAEFNKRIAAFGADKIRLRYDAFTDLHPIVYEAIVGKGTVAKPGLRSTQRVAPSSVRDLIVGDHVVFFNHLGYDLINERIGNAWRLENAVLVRREPKGGDVFLGHGSGRKSEPQMHAKLAEEFNDVAKIAIGLTRKVTSKDPKIAAKAQADLSGRFPKIARVGAEWRIVGLAGLCTRVTLNEKLREIRSDEVVGLKDPCDQSKLYVVERPLESAKGKP